MSYNHGVYTYEQSTSIVPPRTASAALPVVFGTAPVHMTADGSAGKVNTPAMFYSYAEAVTAYGYSTDWSRYTLSEFFKTYFGLFVVAPIVVVNVFDPAIHKTAVTDEAGTFDTDDLIQLAHEGVVGDITVKKDSTEMLLGTDYAVDKIQGVVFRVDGGSLAAGDSVTVSYEYGDPTLVTSSDIIGGIDATTGAKKGLELVDDVFPRFRLVPGQIVAPGWSQDNAVAAVMVAKAGNINAHFRATAVVDIQDATVTKYSDVPAWKNSKNLVDENLVVCWPKVKLGDDEFWLSSQVAALTAQVDADNEGVPYVSPSNHNLQMDSCVNNGDEVWLGPQEANYLNSNGIVTALNFIGGWKLWGSRTGCYPGVTDVKDAFIPIKRMFHWIANELVLTFWQKTDAPINRRLIETITDSYNIRLNGLASRQFILGGRVAFQNDENPTTDIMDGKILFHIYVTPPSPAREIDFLLEYDPAYIETLFG